MNLIRLLACAFAALLLAGCGSMNVMSDGAEGVARLQRVFRDFGIEP